MKIPLNKISTPGLLKLMRDVAAELDTRLQTPEIREEVDARPVTVLRAPLPADADFILMLKARLQRGGYAKAEERVRAAAIAKDHGDWVTHQGLPRTSHAGDWQRATIYLSAARAPRKA